ncbi:MAG TPA: hypothetical protein VGI10_07140 [Polyangiaceae bacterium]|jgi:hypothetical protein
MTNGARKTPSSPLIAPAEDERSAIRSRDGEAPADTSARKAARRSDPELTLDQRLEKKMLAATSMLAKLDPHDTRARLLHIAVLRRDETLIDGVLAELALPPAPKRGR